MTADAEMIRTTLYRHFDADGRLLYVGVSLSVFMRLRQHRADAVWHEKIARVDLEHFKSRAEALEAEKKAIVKEKPLHNVIHNGGGYSTFESEDSNKGRWLLRARDHSHTKRTDLWLYPEINCSACVGDVYRADGLEQLRYYCEYMQTHYPKEWRDDAIPIFWYICGNGVFESEEAPCPRPDGQRGGGYLKYYYPPIDASTGEEVNWYKLPVINKRFPELAKALGWLPSPFQMFAPLRSISGW